MKYEAVIFDLFGTLIDSYTAKAHEISLNQMASVLHIASKDLIRLWSDTFTQRNTGVFQSAKENIEYICHEFKVSLEDTQLELAAQMRHDFTERSMQPRMDAIEVLSHLKERDYKTGLITNCTPSVPMIWKESSFAPFFDVTVFSCLASLMKPDQRIYELAVKQLVVQPEDCLYIGDGGSQELTGASQVGMHPVLIRVPYEDSTDPNLINREEWDGPVISSLSEVLDLVK